MTVLAALLITVALNALGLGLLTVSKTETTIAMNHREATELLYAAEAAVETATTEVLHAAAWSGVLTGAIPSAFRDVTMTPRLSSGETIDLNGVTAALQAASDAEARVGANNPRWQLFLFRPLSTIVRHVPSREYVVAWVADDASETDNDPLTDSNGTVIVRARAIGRLGMQRTVDVTIAVQNFGVGILSWRELR